MEQKEERLGAFVLRRGKELFGDSFIVESSEYEMPKFVVREILGKHEKTSVVEMQIMQYADGTEVFVSEGGGFLRKEVLQELQKKGKCKIGIRNNRIGIREKYVTPAGEWLRVNYFSTEEKTCVECFLTELSELRKSTREDVFYPEVKQKDLCAIVWKIVNDTFNSDMLEVLKTEYFPSFDTKEKINYALFTIWIRDDFFVQVRIFPDYQEFVCQRPGRFWRKYDRSKLSAEMWKSYDSKMREYEKELGNGLSKIDERSALIRGGDMEFPYIQIGEVRTSNPKAVEYLCKFMYQKADSQSLWRELRKDTNYVEQRERYLHFY